MSPGAGMFGAASTCGYATRPMGRIGLVLVLLIAAIAVWHPARVAVQAALLLPAVFPSAPIDPLASLPVERSHQVVPYAAGTVDTDTFSPQGGGRHGAVILLLG